MVIYNADGTELVTITPDDKSYRYREIMGEYALTLYFSYVGYLDIPVGCYVEFQGETFTLLQPQNFQKNGTRNFEYTLVLEGMPAVLKKYMFRDTTSRKVKFSLTATPEMHVQMIVDNLNNRANESGWTLGEVVDTTEIALSYSSNTLWEALDSIASELDTEWEVTSDKVINLKKIGYNKDAPLTLSYGKGCGFRPELKRENYSDTERAIEVLYVQGGEDNIDYSEYGNQYLLLPKSQSIGFDGTYFEDEDGYGESKARKYITDEDGLYVKRSDKTLSTYEEGAFDGSDYYPSRVGAISSVDSDDIDDNECSFNDDSIPEDLDFEDCLISGETMTVIFQSGMLTGKEFEVDYTHSSRKFALVAQEIDGVPMPNETWIPAVGDTYAVFGISLPDAYVCDNDSKEGASWDMLRAGVSYLYENEDPKYTFSGELDPIYLRNNWGEIGGKLVLGGYINLPDEQFEPDGIDIRIKNIKDYVNNFYNVEVELSNITQSGSFSTTIGKIDQNEVTTETKNKETIQYAKRRFRDVLETSDLLAAAFDYYQDAISPVTVQTMQLIVGDESLQFRFVDCTDDPSSVAHNVTFADSVLISPSGIIQHMTLGISSLSSEHSVDEYMYWTMSEYNSAALTETETAYYLYAKCSKSEETGVFLLSETAIGIEDVDGYYHLLVGILNSENEDGERSYVDMYGYTEVLPGRITTEKIISSDGDSYFDMVNSALKLNDKLQYNVDGDGKLLLQGTLVQSSSGDVSQIACFRGAYSSSITYYEGDSVTYNGSTWQYVYSSGASGKTPAEGTYWTCIAAAGTDGNNGADGTDGTNGNDGSDGADGSNGDYYEYRYRTNGSTTSAPSLSTTSRTPANWSTSMPTVSSLTYLWMTVAQISGDDDSLLTSWRTPVRVTPYDGTDGTDGQDGQDGTDGADGATGPSAVYQGVYDSGKTYYGTSTRVDIVKYSSAYYVARVDAGTFTAQTPTNTSYWNSFGAQFESVATDLLFAELAYIENLGVNYLRTASSGARVEVNRNGGNNIEIYDSDDSEGSPTMEITEAKILVEPSGTRFLRINNTTSCLMQIRADGVKGIYIYTQDTTGVGLHIAAQTGGSAIQSYGNHIISARSSEQNQLLGNTLIEGFGIGSMRTSSSSTLYLDYNDTFINYTGTSNKSIYLWDSPTTGKIYFIRRQKSITLTVRGNGHTIYYSNNDSTSSYQLPNSGMIYMFVFDGTYWNLGVLNRNL